MSSYLAVDGGNSKTDVVVGTADGSVLAQVHGPGTCYQSVGLPEALGRLRDLVDRARSEAGVAGPVDRAELFLAGADLPAEVAMLSDAVSGLGWATTTVVENDIMALLRAGTADPDAVVVVCGAGINAAGRARDGRLTRFPALGMVSGDWGGGLFLGGTALWHAVRAEDGRGPATALATAVPAHFGLSTAEQVSGAVHLGALAGERLAELPPVIFEAAARGDAVAGALLARQAEEITTLARVCATRLGLLDAPHTVVLGGGILRARRAPLHDAVVNGIAGRSPAATVTVADAPPVLGAALAALDALGAPAGAHAKVRAALNR